MTHLLIVEDNQDNLDMLSRRLQRRGYAVLIATDGEMGVKRASDDHPDLILMDISLPILNGWEATRQIRANSSTSQIPIIALTAHAMAGDREKALDAGCTDYHTKPVEFDRLIQQIEHLLTSRSES
ncbi:MAG TPA: response regulator [Pirellula sp.]|nr:response regulator [Pirellula sp.]